MAMDNVMLALRRRFAAPLPEYYQRRVIFWQDEEREFDGRVEALVPDHVRLLRLDRANAFAVKRALPSAMRRWRTIGCWPRACTARRSAPTSSPSGWRR